jgi:uncharacterized protein (DUF58 family)
MLTRSGWGAVAAASLAVALGRLFGVIELYVLAVAILVAVGWAAAATARPFPRLRAQRSLVPSVVRAGEPARVDLLVVNDGHRRSPVLRLWEPVGSAGASMNLAPLRAGERTVAAYRLPTSTRGIVSAGPLRVRRSDVLGLASRATTLPGTIELLVTPHHQPVDFGDGSIGGTLGEFVRMKTLGQSGTEFHSLRPYSVGDDLRRVDWKASARSNDWIVKETSPEGMRRCTIVFDASGRDDPEEFERAVSVAASLVTGAAVSGLITRFVSSGVDMRGPDVADVALRWLATVEPSAGDLEPPSGGRFGDGIGIVLLVTSRPAGQPVDVMRSVLTPDDVMVLVCTADQPRMTGRFVVDASNDERFIESWARLAGRSATTEPASSGGGGWR